LTALCLWLCFGLCFCNPRCVVSVGCRGLLRVAKERLRQSGVEPPHSKTGLTLECVRLDGALPLALCWALPLSSAVRCVGRLLGLPRVAKERLRQSGVEPPHSKTVAALPWAVGLVCGRFLSEATESSDGRIKCHRYHGGASLRWTRTRPEWRSAFRRAGIGENRWRSSAGCWLLLGRR
jgi:hypothetical protein